MENMEIYEKYRKVPEEALKDFDNGSFKGTDINSMWRIKCLTEQFGVVGHGWTVKVLRVWTEKCEYTNEIFAFAEIEMQVCINGEWGKPFTATGGNKFCQYIKSKDYYKGSDEAFKMAITDAFGVACKYLGIGADVYFANDKSKYTENTAENTPKKPEKKTEVLTLEKALTLEFEAKGKAYKLGDCTIEQLLYLKDHATDNLLKDGAQLVLMDRARTGNVVDENHD